MLNGKQLQQYLIQEAEDRGVGADAKRERQYCYGGEKGAFAKTSQSVAQVLPACLDERFPAARANDFLADFEASSLQADCTKGFLASHPVLHLLFGGHLLIGAKLFIQLPVNLFLSEQRSHPPGQISQQRHSCPLMTPPESLQLPLLACPILAFRYLVSFAH